ncbi:MAG: ATP-binding protein [Acidimicrobiales bacterium]
MIFQFANCELDLGRVVFRRDGNELHLEPQVFDVLSYLVAHPGQLVRKGDLLDHVWGDRFVSDSALTTQIKFARQAVGDSGAVQRVIRTVHGKGYEFIAEVRVVDVAPRPQVGNGPNNHASPEPSGDANAERAGSAAPRAEQGSRLPASVHTLIGRDDLLDELVAQLASSRLLTLVGAGGVGKTSVGYELARRVAADYADGVYLVELVTVVDEGATFEALATALDVNTRQRGSIEDAIVDMLRPRNALVVLDNCEHLVEPVAALVARTMRAAPAVSILATSREPLAVNGEQVWTIEPLPTDPGAGVGAFDPASVPAVALFLERARAADPTFRLDASTAPAVVEICRRLDGIPLAIELAASRARAIDVNEMALRLDERFRLLKGVRRGADPRHRTLHDAISWSYELLSEDERRLFASLAVFAGPFDLSAAEAVCGAGDVLDLLTRLTERSMLVVRRRALGGTRYELLETLREYARRRLDDGRSVELFAAHANHFTSLARSYETAIRTSAEREGGARADAAFADLRAAQRFALQIGDLDTALSLIGSIREYAMRALRYEVFGWAEAAAAQAEAAGHPLRSLMLAIAAYGAWVRGEYERAVALAESARALERSSGEAPSGLVERVLANVYYTVGQLDDGMAEAARQVEVAEHSGIASRVAHACYMYSVASSSTGALEEGRRLAARARAAGAQTGSPTDLASALVADAYAADPDHERALEAFAAADRLARLAGNRWMSAFARTEASGILLRRGQLTEACAELAELVDLWHRAGEWSQQWHTLTRCMMALDRLGQAGLAAEVVGAIDAHAAMGAPPSMGSLRTFAFEIRDSLSSQLGADRMEQRCAAGASRPLVETVDRVRSALLGRAVDAPAGEMGS